MHSSSRSRLRSGTRYLPFILHLEAKAQLTGIPDDKRHGLDVALDQVDKELSDRKSGGNNCK